MMRLLLIDSQGGVDKVLILQDEGQTDDQCIEAAMEAAELFGEVYVSARMDVPDDFARALDSMLRPFVG